MKLRYEWYANSTAPDDRSGTACFHVPGVGPAAVALDDDRVGAELARLIDAAYAAGRRDEASEWTESLKRLAAQRGREG
ncbi:hypothetical protein [Pseudomonas sp.]|uniref:hypothetical protein n=1 Tax=Pseudomonas sp. TaxID=306 RepID=UPI0032422297